MCVLFVMMSDIRTAHGHHFTNMSSMTESKCYIYIIVCLHKWLSWGQTEGRFPNQSIRKSLNGDEMNTFWEWTLKSYPTPPNFQLNHTILPETTDPEDSFLAASFFFFLVKSLKNYKAESFLKVSTTF